MIPLRARVFVFIFTVMALAAHAQRDTTSHFKISSGFAIALGEEIDKVYDLGLKFTTGISFPVLKARLRISPVISLQYFGNNYNEGTRDNLLYWNLGGRIERNPKMGIASFCPYAGVYYLTGNDYLTPRKDYKGSRIDIMSFKGTGLIAGFRVYMKSNFFIDMGADFVKPTGKLDGQLVGELKEELNATSTIYDFISVNDARMSFTNVSFSVGYKVSL